MKCQYIVVQVQQVIDQVFEYWCIVVGLQFFFVDDVYVVIVVCMCFLQELVQYCVGLGNGGVVQVQFVLDGILVVFELLEYVCGQGVVLVVGGIVGFQWVVVVQQLGKFVVCCLVILFGYVCVWFWLWCGGWWCGWFFQWCDCFDC